MVAGDKKDEERSSTGQAGNEANVKMQTTMCLELEAVPPWHKLPLNRVVSLPIVAQSRVQLISRPTNTFLPFDIFITIYLAVSTQRI